MKVTVESLSRHWNFRVCVQFQMMYYCKCCLYLHSIVGPSVCVSDGKGVWTSCPRHVLYINISKNIFYLSNQTCVVAIWNPFFIVFCTGWRILMQCKDYIRCICKIMARKYLKSWTLQIHSIFISPFRRFHVKSTNKLYNIYVHQSFNIK